MAPECVMHGQFSPRSDVYCFGILLVEIVSGMRNECSNQPEHAGDLAWRYWNERQTMELIDPVVREYCPITEPLPPSVAHRAEPQKTAVELDAPTMGSVESNCISGQPQDCLLSIYPPILHMMLDFIMPPMNISQYSFTHAPATITQWSLQSSTPPVIRRASIPRIRIRPLSSCALPLLLFSCLLPFHFLAKAQAQVHVFCNNPTNYTSGSVFQRNLNLVLSSFAASASISDFNMTTVGQDPDTVYGLIQCRSKNKTLRTTIVVVIVATIAFIVASTVCGCFLWRRRKTRKISFDSVHEDSNTSMDSLLFDLKTLKAATKNFSDEYKLGQGGFGPVYKGKLPDGREIAVKRLSSSSGQGLEELRTEVTLVTKLLHRNLADKSKGSSLGWERRYKIIYGIARGLLYLHEDSQLRIIHRDMKVSNILLDKHMNPKISDFGLARLFCGSQTHGNTNQIAGYMFLCYVNVYRTHRPFLFVDGMKWIHGTGSSSFYNSMNLQNLAWQQWANGTALDLVDPALADQFPIHEVLTCIQIGLLCIQDDAADRPSMSKIVLMLSRDFEADEKREDSDAAKLDQNNRKAIQLYVNEVTISELTQAQVYVYCDAATNYTSGSVYEKNLNLVLTSLVASASITGFNMTTAGQDPDVAYGLIQCRPDISKGDCQTCSSTSAVEISQRCPNQREAFIQYDICSLHYSDWRFFSTVNSVPQILVNVHDMTNPVLFNDQLESLFENLSSRAASNPSLFAIRSTLYTGSTNIYGMVQCTRDLTENNCLGCLQDIRKYIPSDGSQGGQVISLSCSLRYEISPFFLLPPPPPPIRVASPPPPFLGGNSTPTGTSDGENQTLRTIVIVAILVAIACIVVSIICGCFLWRTRRQIKKISFDGVYEGSNTSTESLLIDLTTLKVATRNFSDECKLGEGGFGPVYKGELSDGREIAVKRLSSTSGQGLEELTTEVMLVTKLLHKNLVKLLGFCLEEEEKLLVYEYLPNGSLDKILFDHSRRFSLEWERRYKIIVGIARGLLYLHEDSQLRIIHRDMKASNILLDEQLNPKISDFGLARLFHGSQTQGNTNRIAGTCFGILVLEVVAGRKNSGFHNSVNLQNLAWQHWANGTALDLVDPRLGDQWPRHEVLECIQTGLLCIQEVAADRPSMSEIVLMLSSHTITTPVPLHPPVLAGSRNFESSETMDATKFDQYNRKALQQSVNDVTISELTPRN
ncbi:hypothetical protein AAG906_039882 [Vitis piasezkii]